MEFKEFTNPEEKNYDLKSTVLECASNDETELSSAQKVFVDLWIDLGMPEVHELETFGIMEKEFEKPTKQTIIKLKNYAKRKK